MKGANARVRITRRICASVSIGQTSQMTLIVFGYCEGVRRQSQLLFSDFERFLFGLIKATNCGVPFPNNDG